jgi:hypothetical protein
LARRTLRRRSSARASNTPRAPGADELVDVARDERQSSLAAAGFGAQSTMAIARSARLGGRDQAHGSTTPPLRVRTTPAPRQEPRVPRAPHAPGPRRRCPRPGKSAGQQRVEVPRPARPWPKKPPGLGEGDRDPPATARHHVHDAEHPAPADRPPQPHRPSRTAGRKRRRRAAPASTTSNNAQQAPLTPNPTPQLPRIQPQSRHTGRRLPPLRGPAPCLVAIGIAPHMPTLAIPFLAKHSCGHECQDDSFWAIAQVRGPSRRAARRTTASRAGACSRTA